MQWFPGYFIHKQKSHRQHQNRTLSSSLRAVITVERAWVVVVPVPFIADCPESLHRTWHDALCDMAQKVEGNETSVSRWYADETWSLYIKMWSEAKTNSRCFSLFPEPAVSRSLAVMNSRPNLTHSRTLTTRRHVVKSVADCLLDVRGTAVTVPAWWFLHRNACHKVRRLTILHRESKRGCHPNHGYNCQFLIDLQNSFTAAKSSKFQPKPILLGYPPHVKYVAALPCKT